MYLEMSKTLARVVSNTDTRDAARLAKECTRGKMDGGG